MSPGGVRIGSPALTTRGMKEPEFRQIADFMARAAELSISLRQSSGKLLKDFVIAMEVSVVAQTVEDCFMLLTLSPLQQNCTRYPLAHMAHQLQGDCLRKRY